MIKTFTPTHVCCIQYVHVYKGCLTVESMNTVGLNSEPWLGECWWPLHYFNMTQSQVWPNIFILIYMKKFSNLSVIACNLLIRMPNIEKYDISLNKCRLDHWYQMAIQSNSSHLNNKSNQATSTRSCTS